MANGCQSTRCAAAMSLGCWRGSPSLRTKYGSGQGRSFRSSLCRRRVWTAFGSIACCKMKGSKATSSIPPRSRCPAGADERRLTRSTENPWCARCWRINEVSRECAPWSRRRPRKRRIAGEFAVNARLLTAERVRHVNRIKGLFFAQGISDYEPLRRKRRERLEELRTGDGRPLPQHLKAQIGRELDRLELILQQIRSVETERDALLSPSKDGAPAPGAMLKSLKGVGPEFAGVLWSEGLYRSFSNRRQVAAYAGLGPTPWQSGSVAHEQGVSKAGNPRLRTTMIQLAWLWVRHQPGSILAQWFHQRVQFNGGRIRKVLIVALARKLLIAFWKYVTAGIVPEGAEIVAA